MAPLGSTQRRHAELLAQLARVREQQEAHRRDCASFLDDVAAPEKTAALHGMRDLRALTPEVTVLCAQTGAVVERIANANDVAAKMTKEVRRIDVLQSRLTATLAQATQLLSLRNALAGIRRAMQLQQYPDAAAYLKQLKEIEKCMALDVADKLRVDTIESDLKAVIESAFADGLATSDRGKVHVYAPLFQIVGEDYEERGFVQLLRYITADLEAQLAPMATGSFSTKELMDHVTSIFNLVAAVVQEYDQLTTACFPRVNGTHRLLQSVYAISEKASVATLNAYIKQRRFHDRMEEEATRADSRMTPAASAAAASASTKISESASGAEDAIAFLNEQLNEVALMIQHTQTYERFMRSRVLESDAVDTVLPSSSESELSKTVQELAGYYCFFENDLLKKAAQKAFQWEELRFSSRVATESSGHDSSVVSFPISSAIDEIFYVARNSGLRGLATGHADCAAGVLNIINTVLRDSLGDTMRFRIRNMAAHVGRFDNESGLMAASSQLRDQMQQQLAKLSKIQGVGAITSGNVTATSAEAKKELGPDVVMNSLEATGDYIAQLKTELEAELHEDFDDVPSHLQTCLTALDDAATELSQLLVVSRKKLGKVLEPRLSTSLAPLLATNAKKPVSYELGDHAFTMNEANDPFAHAFVVVVRDLVRAFQPTLSPTNFASVVDVLASTTCELLERWFHSRHAKFSALGALQFDKDLRVISGCFNELTDCRVRFATLAQIAMVLNVDAPSDVADFFGRRTRGGVEWKLSASQVKDILGRRLEFSDAAISKVGL